MTFRLGNVSSDLEHVIALERGSYPLDEAARPDQLRARLHEASDYFLVALDGEGGPIVGFITGTRANTFDHDSMGRHDPSGALLCIHSVVVAPDQRRRGLGLAMLREYIARMRAMSSTAAAYIKLMCKKPLIPFYEQAGFQLVGPSAIEHGKDPWFECSYTLRK